MPSGDIDAAAFTSIDWSERSRRRRRPDARTIGLVLALAAVAAAFAYDYLVSPEELVWFIHWDLSRIDWLFLVSTVLVTRYVAVPMLANRDRSARTLRALLTRPAGALSLGFIVVFCFLGIVGPDTLYGVTFPRLKYRLQPPVFTSVYVGDQSYYNCAGRVVGEYCHGSWAYPLGTNRYGENVVTLLMYGTRVALKIALVTAVLMAVVATAVGTAAGYFRGWVDDVLMGYLNVQQTIPAIVVYIVLATMFFGNIEGVSDGGIFVFVLVFGLLDWGGIARLVRTEVLTRRSAGYVRAARAAGASDLQVVRRHVVPNSAATVVTALTRRIPLLVLAQVALAYLSLNRINSQSFGRILRVGLEGRHMHWTQKWWVTTSAVVVLVLTVVAFNVFGDVARDVLDPREGVE